MKKILVLLLLIVSTSVFAEWNKVGQSGADGDMTTYADSETIKRKGNKVKMWTMYDFKTVRKLEHDRYLSMVTHDEYDCEEETLRILDVYWYSGNMKDGEIVYSQTNIKTEENSIMPRSVNESLFKIACGKK